MHIQAENNPTPFNPNPLKTGISVWITRGRFLEDGLVTINNLSTNLRQRIDAGAILYYNKAGAKEVRIDSRGLF